MNEKTFALIDRVKETILQKDNEGILIDFVKNKLGPRFNDYNEHLVLYIEDGARLIPLGFSPVRKKVLPIPLSFSDYLKCIPQLNYVNVLIALTTYLQFSYKRFYNIFEQSKSFMGVPFDAIDDLLSATYSFILFDEQLEIIYRIITGASSAEAMQFRKEINYCMRTAASSKDWKEAKEIAMQQASSIKLLPGFSLFDLLSKHNWYFYVMSQPEDHASAFLLYQYLQPQPSSNVRKSLKEQITLSYPWDESLFDAIKQEILSRNDTSTLAKYVRNQLTETFDDYEEHLVIYLVQGVEKIPLQFISSTQKIRIPSITFAQYLKKHYKEDYQSVLKAISSYLHYDEQEKARMLLHEPFKNIGVPYESIDQILACSNGYILFKDQLVWIYRLLTGSDQETALQFCKLHNRKSPEAIKQAKNIYLKPNFSLYNLLAWRCWDDNQFVFSPAYHQAWLLHCHLQQRKTNAAWNWATENKL